MRYQSTRSKMRGPGIASGMSVLMGRRDLITRPCASAAVNNGGIQSKARTAKVTRTDASRTGYWMQSGSGVGQCVESAKSRVNQFIIIDPYPSGIGISTTRQLKVVLVARHFEP